MPRRLNSIGSQLALSQAATVLAALAAASLTTLAISRESVLKARESHLRRDAALIQQTYDNTQGIPERARQQRLAQLLATLGGSNHAYWISTASGSTIFPAQTRNSIPAERLTAIEQATKGRQDKGNWRSSSRDLQHSMQTPIRIDQQSYLASRYKFLSYFSALWVTQNITDLSSLQASLIRSTTGIYIGSVALSLVISSLLTRRITRPLKVLSLKANTIQAENLTTTRLSIAQSSNEIAELSSAFNALLARLDMSLQSQRQFSRSLSHELRNPLMTLELCQRRLKRELRHRSAEAAMQTVAIQQQELNRMKKLLDGLMTLFKAGQALPARAIAIVSLEEVIQEAVEASSNAGDGHAIAVIREQGPTADPEAWQAMADREQLEQALINLISNAKKYSDPQQTIAIRLEARHAHMAVIVEDHGIGIPLEDQARIFEPFFRGSNTGGHEGTGLGLPVVKALVESMGGRLEVWSQPSQGSRFTILLPRQPSPSGLREGLA